MPKGSRKNRKHPEKREFSPIGAAVKYLRHEQNLSITTVSELTGVTEDGKCKLPVKRISEIENGVASHPQTQTLALIATALGLEVSDILKKAEFLQTRAEETIWYLARDSKRYAPMTDDELHQHIYSGHIQPNDYLWHKKIDNWVEANKIPNLSFGTEEIPPSQKPAIFQYTEMDGKIDVLKLDSKTRESGFANDTYNEVKEKLSLITERMSKSQTPKYILNSIGRLSVTLGNNLADLRPGLLRSRSRNIEAIIKSYDSVEGKEELYPNALSEMFDLLGSLQDLQSYFSEIREIEAEALALNITSSDVLDKVHQRKLEIIKIIRDSNIISEKAKESLVLLDENIEDTLSEKEKTHLLAEIILNIRNIISAILKPIVTEIGNISYECLMAARNKLPEGVGNGFKKVGQGLVLVPFIYLGYLLAGSVGGLAAVISRLRTH